MSEREIRFETESSEQSISHDFRALSIPNSAQIEFVASFPFFMKCCVHLWKGSEFEKVMRTYYVTIMLIIILIFLLKC